MERVCALGARPFEVITGSPHGRYGARVTFETPEAIRDRVAAEFGLSTHPWGAPDWIGLRVSPDGDVVWKAYHRADRAAPAVSLPHALPMPLVPVMAARHDGTDELYFRRGDACDWVQFVDSVCSAMRMDASQTGELPTADCRLPTFHPLPRPHANSFCLSVKVDHDTVTALSFFADDRALPGDRDITAAWTASFDADDRAAYDAALAGVRATGPRPARGWHAMLAWTVDRRRGWSRAASLRIR